MVTTELSISLFLLLRVLLCQNEMTQGLDCPWQTSDNKKKERKVRFSLKRHLKSAFELWHYEIVFSIILFVAFMQNTHLSQKTFPALSSNCPLVDVGSFGHLLKVKGIKTSGSSIYFASGHGRDIETGCESTNHSLLSTCCKSFL